jgi:hypothetical protein
MFTIRRCDCMGVIYFVYALEVTIVVLCSIVYRFFLGLTSSCVYILRMDRCHGRQRRVWGHSRCIVRCSFEKYASICIIHHHISFSPPPAHPQLGLALKLCPFN